MKFTLSECVQRINQVLNYPSVTYEDISHFFDHAIAELNTSLRTAIPSVSEMVSDNTVDTSMQANTVLLTTYPSNAVAMEARSTIPTEPPAVDEPMYVYYAKDASMLNRAFYVWNGFNWTAYDTLYGVCFSGTKKSTFVATPLGLKAYWVDVPVRRTLDFDLCEYLTMDWWTLFIIPYVCFKFAVRNGNDGDLYSSEFTQGFQQLQTSYDVPNFVKLSEVAGTPAYTNIVKENLNNLSRKVPTRAVTDSMRVGNAICAVFDNSYSKGGWGL